MKITDLAPFFQGQISLEETEQGLKPWRLPFGDRTLFPSPEDNLMTRAEKASGVRLSFITDAPTLRLTYDIQCEDSSYAFDMTQKGEILDRKKCRDQEKEVIDFTLSGSSEDSYFLWLPHFCNIIVISLEIPEGSTFTPTQDKRLKWLTYGSSITHCRQSDSPAQIWPAVAARKLNLNLTSLGFGGQCHFDGMVAKVIRDQITDIITLKLGINVYGGGSLSERTYLPSVINLIETIREKHPLTPLGIISPIYSCQREREPNIQGNTLEQYREWDKQAVEIFKRRGDQKIEYFDGLTLFGPNDASLLPDDLHPNTEGYRLMGERAAVKILPQLMKLL